MQDFIAIARAFVHLRKRKLRKDQAVQRAVVKAANWDDLYVYGGWKMLGAGHYGEAWAHRDFPDLALKISGPAGWGGSNTQDDMAYWVRLRDYTTKPDAWPVYARHCLHYPAPNLPAIKHFEQVSSSICFAVMPKYSRAHSIPGLGAFTTKVLDYLDWGGHCGAGPDYAWLLPVHQMASALHLQTDLHSGNFMWDAVNMKFILTDPFSCVKNCYRSSSEDTHS